MTIQHVLIVEDDPDMARVLTRAFRARGFDTESVRDAATARLAARAAPPDYAVLDLNLASSSGLALIQPLRSINPAVKILVLTGYASIETAVFAIKLGACHYLAKPAYVTEILSALGINAANDAPSATVTQRHSVDELKWRHILRTLNDYGGNVSEAARVLRMHRRTLQRKLARRDQLGHRKPVG